MLSSCIGASHPSSDAKSSSGHSSSSAGRASSGRQRDLLLGCSSASRTQSDYSLLSASGAAPASKLKERDKRASSRFAWRLSRREGGQQAVARASSKRSPRVSKLARSERLSEPQAKALAPSTSVMPASSRSSLAPATRASISPPSQLNQQKHLSASSASSSSRACEHLAAIGRSQEQHRRLQFQVHQQLQRIYGNKLQELEKQQQQQQRVCSKMQQRRQLQLQLNQHLCTSKQASVELEQAYDSLNSSSAHQDAERRAADHFYELNPARPVAAASDSAASIDQRLLAKSGRKTSSAQAMGQCAAGQHDHDQLHHHHHHHHLQHLLLDHHHHHHRHRQEELLDAGLLPNARRNEQDVEIGLELGDDEEDGEEAEEDENGEAEEDLHEDDQLLLLLDENNNNNNNNNNIKQQHLQNARPIKHPQSGQDQKRQLESLHYATATAAALLNATASAAAALAASSQQQQQQQQQQAAKNGDTRLQAARRQQMSGANQAAAPTYQHLGKLRAVSERAGCAARPDHLLDYLAPPVYARAAEPARELSQALLNNNHRLRQPLPARSLAAAPANQAGEQSQQLMRFMRQQRVQQQQQLQLYNQTRVARQHSAPAYAGLEPLVRPLFHQQHQHQHQHHPYYRARGGQQADFRGQNMLHAQQQPVMQHNQQNSRLQPFKPTSFVHKQKAALPPRPPDIANQLQISSEQQQTPAKAANCVPALAILHHNGKIAALKVDLVASPLVPARPPMAPVMQSKQPHQVYQKSLAAYGFLLGQQQLDKTNRQPVDYASNYPGNYPTNSVIRPLGAAINSAASDASAHSNLPLVLERQVARRERSLIKKICQIDLKILWWCLLGSCVIIIGAVITISRYFHS